MIVETSLVRNPYRQVTASDGASSRTKLAEYLTTFGLDYADVLTDSLYSIINTPTIFTFIKFLQYQIPKSLAIVLAAGSIALGDTLANQSAVLLDLGVTGYDNLIAAGLETTCAYFSYDVLSLATLISPNYLISWLLIYIPEYTDSFTYLQALRVPQYLDKLMMIKLNVDLTIAPVAYAKLKTLSAAAYAPVALGYKDQGVFYDYL